MTSHDHFALRRMAQSAVEEPTAFSSSRRLPILGPRTVHREEELCGNRCSRWHFSPALSP